MGTLASIFMFAGVAAGVDPALVSAVCWVESTHKQDAYVAKDGNTPSLGLCQVKLNTARHMGFKGTEAELMKPKTNALYAAKYLRWQYERYGTWEKAVSSFNCGRVCNNPKYVSKVMNKYRPKLGAL